MDRKQMCVANVQYKKPSADGAKQAKSLLKYLTYRESREEKAKYVAGCERWIDHGMGGSVGEIAKQCEALHSDHVLLFSLVMNPSPDLMAMVEPEDRERFVKDLTERVVDDFFEARGLDTGVEYRSCITETAPIRSHQGGMIRIRMLSYPAPCMTRNTADGCRSFSARTAKSITSRCCMT